jgi:hypothetical protein
MVKLGELLDRVFNSSNHAYSRVGIFTIATETEGEPSRCVLSHMHRIASTGGVENPLRSRHHGYTKITLRWHAGTEQNGVRGG